MGFSAIKASKIIGHFLSKGLDRLHQGNLGLHPTVRHVFFKLIVQAEYFDLVLAAFHFKIPTARLLVFHGRDHIIQKLDFAHYKDLLVCNKVIVKEIFKLVLKNL